MAKKTMFNVPLLDTFDDSPSESLKAQTLFNAHKERKTTEGNNENKTTDPPTKEGPSRSNEPKPQAKGSSLTTSQRSLQIFSSTSVSQPRTANPCTVVPQVTSPRKVNAPPLVSTQSGSPPSANTQPGTGQVAGLTSSPTKSGKASILVSPRQRGNPILKHIRSVPWEFDDIVPDYQLGRTSCALFLSLRYHQLQPNYIHERLRQLGHSYDLRVLLAQIDVKDPHHSLKELARICLLSDCTLMLAFSAEEAGRYLETYKAFESKPPDLIMEKTEGTFLSKFTDSLTSVRRVNKTDAMTLLSAFETFERIVEASEEDLSMCPGFGPQKAHQLYNVLKEPFLKPTKRKTNQETPESNGGSPSKKPSVT